MNLTDPQEVFDTVAQHLIAQGKKSMARLSEDPHPHAVCAYRGENGTKCAVGCLIPDEAYDPSIENTGVVFWKVLRALGVDVEPQGPREDSGTYHARCLEALPTLNLLMKLQTIHDGCPVPLWGLELVKIAQQENLSARYVTGGF
jgi:predicted RNase H-like nuclease